MEKPMIFGIKSAIISEKNLIVNPSEIKNKTRIRPYVHEATDFHNNEIPKQTQIILVQQYYQMSLLLKKYENYYLQVFIIECKKKKKNDEKAKKEIRHMTDDLGN